MQYETYKSIIEYHKDIPEGRDVIPPCLSKVEKATFHCKASLFSFKMQNLYRNGKIVLNVSTIIPDLRNIHQDDLHHQRGYLELERSANRKYHTDNLREAALFVCANCDECSKRRTMGKAPVHTEDCGTIIPATHEPIEVECARPKSSCFLDCLHYLLTGKHAVSIQLQKTLRGQQRKQHPYSPFDPSLSLLDRGFLESDLHILAEFLGVHFYEYRDKEEGPRWNYVAGHKRGRGGAEAIYLYYRVQTEGPQKGEGHSALITGMRPRAS